jgi:hypothetical protein
LLNIYDFAFELIGFFCAKLLPTWANRCPQTMVLSLFFV